MQDDSSVLYALLQLRGEAKLEKKKIMKRLSRLLIGIGK